MIFSVILNILVNVLLLLASAKLCGFVVSAYKIIAAIFLNSLFNIGCYFLGGEILGNNLLWIVLLLFLSVNTFGYRRDSILPSVIFVSMSILYDIAISGLISKKFWSILVLVACILLILFRGFQNGYKRYIPIEIHYRGVKESFVALHDTGNLLRDPLTGDSVLIVSCDIAEQLTGLTRQQLANPVETIQRQPISGLQLLPYTTVGQPHGFLLAMRFQNIKIGVKMRSGLVAFAPNNFFTGCKYQALTGGNVLC